MNFFPRRLWTLVSAGLLTVVGLSVATPVTQAVGNSSKVTICHRTHSVTNPYRRITVAQSSIKGGANSKHGTSGGNHNAWSTTKYPSATAQNPPVPNVFDSTFSYPSNDKKWGDIVPPTDVSGADISGFTDLNYTGDGVDIYNGTNGKQGQCRRMSASEYVQSEVAAGEALADVLADLNEQEANEDVAIKAALGGSFTGVTLQQVSAVGVTTDNPTSVGNTTATLNGSFTLGSASVVSSFFWGTDPTCASGGAQAATPGNATGTVSISGNLTGLSPNTTYYYKAVGTSDVGLETEGTIEGACVSFTTSNTSSSSSSSSSTSSTSSTTSTSSTSSTSSTTVAPSSTIAPSGSVGNLRGTVWIDFNRNGVRDAGEPPLPEISVEIAPVGSSSTTTLRTDSSGRFSATGLTPGRWRVVARLTTDSLDRTYDSNGQPDWIVEVDVPANGEGQADFAAAGKVQVVQSELPTDASGVDVTWEGVDETFTTVDDVTFSISPSNRKVAAQGLPSGRYKFVIVRPASAISVDATLANGAFRLDASGRTLVAVALPETGSSTPVWPMWLVTVGLGLFIVRRMGRFGRVI